jgi:hypothetical protein
MTVQEKVAITESCIAAVKASPDEGSHTREEFRQDKGLGEIVVRTGVQALHSLLDQTSSGEHQDGSLDPSLTQFAADFHAAEAGQTDVEKNGIVSTVRAQFERFLT